MPAKVKAGIKCLSKILDLKQKHLKTKFWPKILEQELSTCVRCIFFPLGWTLPPSLKKWAFPGGKRVWSKKFFRGRSPRTPFLFAPSAQRASPITLHMEHDQSPWASFAPGHNTGSLERGPMILGEVVRGID